VLGDLQVVRFRFGLHRAINDALADVEVLSLGSKVVHHFGDIRRVEGVSVDHEGHAHCVIDEEGHVALRTLVFD